MNQVELVSTPACYNTADPSIVVRWVATDNPVVFSLQRRDYNVEGYIAQITSPDGTAITLDREFTGMVGDNIIIIDAVGNTYLTTVLDAVTNIIVVDIAHDDFTQPPAIVNNNTEYRNFHFEARVQINGKYSHMTVISAPNRLGYADIDVSSLLKIATSKRKDGDYISKITPEKSKSGKFYFEYRGVWWGSDEEWQQEMTDTSPAEPVTWNYVEAIRSEDQGANLSEYIASEIDDAPFLNTFERPVYYRGMPFDISFILPEIPYPEIIVTIKAYDAQNKRVGIDITQAIPSAGIQGYVHSLLISESDVPEGASYFTVSIEAE